MHKNPYMISPHFFYAQNLIKVINEVASTLKWTLCVKLKK